MARKKPSASGILLIIVIVAIGAIVNFIAEHPKELMFIGGLAIGGWLIYKLVNRTSTRDSVGVEPSAGEITPADDASEAPIARPRIRFTIPTVRESHGFRSKSTNGDEFWIPRDGTADVAGHRLGSMFYVGSGLGSIGGGEPEPALIDPKLPVDPTVHDCSVRRLNYWPSYNSASAEARAAYLHWLRTGRAAADADIGYVFLYFYGLERRAVHDARTSASAAAEIPHIESEVTRLLSLYGNQRSFTRYATALLDFLHAKRLPVESYTRPPIGRVGQALGFVHRLALAQCAADRKPLPPAWAHFWITSHGAAGLGMPARRCPDEFKRLFESYYCEKFGDGLVLPENRTRLKLEYRPASASFRGAMDDLVIDLNLPDVSILTSPVRQFELLGIRAAQELERYSRVVGKNPESASTFEALVELPISLWPEQYRQPVQSLHEVVSRAGKPAAIPFEKFRSWLPSWNEVTRPKLRSLSTALAAAGLGMEPDVRFGGSAPAIDSRVVLFADDPSTATSEPSARYLAAALTLHLAAAVVTADGEVDDVEKALLARQLEAWLHLTESERRRLQALLRFLFAQPPKLSGLKKRIDGLDRPSRESLGDFLAVVAQADQSVTPQEIKTLQKIFKLLGLAPESVFSKVHVAATEPITVQPATPVKEGRAIPQPPAARLPSGIRLDAAKIAALQKDSERVAAILADVFQEPEATRSVDQEPESPLEAPEPGLLGLDPMHSMLLETLLTRTHWSRTELEELAVDRTLMLDGALESMNEACFERFEMALFEGSDPVVFNPDAMREVQGGHHQES